MIFGCHCQFIYILTFYFAVHLQRKIKGRYNSTVGGSFRIVYLSGEIFVVDAVYGRGLNNCSAIAVGGGSGRIAMTATSNLKRRHMTYACTLNVPDFRGHVH